MKFDKNIFNYKIIKSYLCQADYVFTCICQLAGLKDFDETLKEDVSQPRIDPMNHWCRSALSLSLKLRDMTFF